MSKPLPLTPAVEPLRAPRAPPSGSTRTRARALIAALALAAIAAGIVAIRLGRLEPIGQRAAVATPAGARAPAARPAPLGAAAATAPAGDDREALKVTADDLPSAVGSSSIASGASGASAARALGPAVKPSARDGTGSASKISAVDLPKDPARDPGDLGDAMRGAVGDQSATNIGASEAKPAASAKQLRPSPGAVVGAIGAALPEARACLGPDDPIRTGTVVFKSDGSIARVDLEGARPTDPCIRAALAKARIEPFVDDSFATRVTVRP